MAVRLEQQPVYAVDLDEHYEAFAAGRVEDPTGQPAFADWLEYVSALTAAGRRMERVRVQHDPPSDYHRYARWVGGWNVKAGEVIHYTTRDRAAEVGLLPAAGDDDWWLLDDARLVVMEFDAAGELTRIRLVTDEASIARARAHWELALRAVPS
jgi:hypothetical protein